MNTNNFVFDIEVFEPVMSGATAMRGIHRDAKGSYITTTRGIFRSNVDWNSVLEYGRMYSLIIDEECMSFAFDAERALEYLIW